MDLQEISALTPGGLAYPIEVRLLRKWTPFYNKNECHYIFVDKSGNAIEAVSNKKDPSHCITSMNILSCYRLEDYICQDVKTSMRSVSQSVTIKLGKAATITPILNEDIPSYYFEFLKYDLLQSRINNNAILTDYIGKIISISDTQTRSNISLLKMKVQDLSDNIVEIALWEEVANSFDKKTFWTLPHPVIAAFSSLKVSEYRGEVQLGSTTATCVYVNPDIEIAKTLSDRFKNSSTISTLANESIKTEVSQEENKYMISTLADLLLDQSKKIKGKQYICTVAIMKIDLQHGWFYEACKTCNKRLLPRGPLMACEDHGDMQDPRHLYCFAATIADDTSITTAKFFNDAITTLLNTTCKDVVVNQGFTDPTILPAPLHAILGKKATLQIQFARKTNKSSPPFTVNHVLGEPTTMTTTNNQNTSLTVMEPEKTSTADFKRPSRGKKHTNSSSDNDNADTKRARKK